MGPERTATSIARCVSSETLGAVLQHLRRAGLDSVVAKQLRGKSALLEDVRTEAAKLKSIEVPKLAEPRRISWPNLILIIGTLIGGWALIGTLINVTNSIDTIIGADWAWVVVAFICCQLAFVGSAVEDVGSVAGDLPLGRVVAVEIANSFSGLAGGSPAVFATRVRFFQQEGYDSSVAVSSGAVITAVSWTVKGLLFLVCLPLAWGSIHLDDHPDSGSGHTVWLLLVAVIVIAAPRPGVRSSPPTATDGEQGAPSSVRRLEGRTARLHRAAQAGATHRWSDGNPVACGTGIGCFDSCIR